MPARLLGRPIVTDADLTAAAEAFAEALRPFAPTRVVYIETGGARLGTHLAAVLAIPCEGLPIRYPRSHRSPFAKALLFPLKEVMYRLQRPKAQGALKLLATADDRIVLVDDSASSGRTLRLALSALEERGIPRDRTRTAVYRRGSRAAAVTDLFRTKHPVHFSRRSFG